MMSVTTQTFYRRGEGGEEIVFILQCNVGLLMLPGRAGWLSGLFTFACRDICYVIAVIAVMR